MRVVLTLVTILLAALLPSRVQALPVFAHRFGLSCQACHTTVPHLNAFGEAFARNGFRLRDIRARAIVPVAVKVNLTYSSDADPTGLPKAIVDEVELLTGGAIGNRVNYFLEQYAVDGGRPGRPRDAWAQYNSDNGALHVRAGEFTLPLPVDPETQRDTEAHYLVYDQTVAGNSFDFFDPRIGIDAYTAGADGSGMHVAALTHGDLLAYGAKSIGRFTFYAYRYQSNFYRQGYGVRRCDGKFDFIAVVQQGRDQGTGSSGGFAETHYAFSPSLMAVARYDRVWDALAGAQHQTVFSLVTRPARNMRFTIEDAIADHHTISLGWLLAY
jgi:hypothetical protein